MKKILFILFLFSSIVSSAQISSNNDKKSFEIFGYVNGIRLDSINATYAKVYYKSSALKKKEIGDYQYPLLDSTLNILCFSYQGVKSKEELTVKDVNGNYISLQGDYAELLNFFYFNGWDLFKIIYDDPKNTGYSTLMKKIEKVK